MTGPVWPGPPPPVTVDLAVDRVGAADWISYPAQLAYDPGDPLAVRLIFLDTDPANDVTWVFGRDLLRAGLGAPAGEGDVRVWPALYSRGSLFVHLRVPGEDGALFEVSREVAARFLAATDQLIPPGSEERHQRLDAELDQLGDATP